MYRPTLAQIADIVLDASVNETHQGDVDVTDHPVEEGADISDHARVKPETVSIEAVISNTPLNSAQQKRVQSAQGDVTAETVGVDSPAGAVGFAEVGYVRLKQLKDARQLVKVITGLRVYDNMMLTSLSIPRNAGVGDALRFTAQFKQVRLAQVRVKIVKVAKEPKANAKVDTGKQVAGPQPTPSTSLHKLLNGGADLFGASDSLRGVGITPD
jgi:hypothetical protein